MEDLNINEYLNKVDGSHLCAEEWNALHETLQDKINEITASLRENITLGDAPEIVEMTPEQVRVRHLGAGTGAEMTSEEVKTSKSLSHGGSQGVSVNTERIQVEKNDQMGTGYRTAYMGPGSISVSKAATSSHPSEGDKQITISANDGISINGVRGINTTITIAGVTLTFTDGILTSYGVDASLGD